MVTNFGFALEDTTAAVEAILFFQASNVSAECGIWAYSGDATAIYKRWADDPDSSRWSLDAGDYVRFYQSLYSNRCTTFGYWVTWHEKTYTLSGTVSNYSDDGSGLTVRFFRVRDGLYIGSTTTTTGGAFSLPWYDDTEAAVAVCQEDSVRVGASAEGVGS